MVGYVVGVFVYSMQGSQLSLLRTLQPPNKARMNPWPHRKSSEGWSGEK